MDSLDSRVKSGDINSLEDCITRCFTLGCAAVSWERLEGCWLISPGYGLATGAGGSLMISVEMNCLLGKSNSNSLKKQD